MRLGTWRWVVVLLLVSQVLLQGCNLVDSTEDAVPDTREVRENTPQPTVNPLASAAVTPDSPVSAGQKPPKPEAQDGGFIDAQNGAAATVEPLPTVDPSRDDWTVLVYMSAANGLDAAAVQALDEMEEPGQ